MIHFHYFLIGYNKKTGNQMDDFVEIDLIGLTVSGAIKRAKELYPKKYWTMRRVTECFGMHGDEIMKSLGNMFEKLSSQDKQKIYVAEWIKEKEEELTEKDLTPKKIGEQL